VRDAFAGAEPVESAISGGERATRGEERSAVIRAKESLLGVMVLDSTTIPPEKPLPPGEFYRYI
jgi:hypothetical protein